MATKHEKIVAGLLASGATEIERVNSYRVFVIGETTRSYWFVTNAGKVRLNTFRSMKNSAIVNGAALAKLIELGDTSLRAEAPTRIKITPTGLVHKLL